MPEQHFVPLDVGTIADGFLRLRGVHLVTLFAFITGGLGVYYEMVRINVEDADFRDSLYDYRVTLQSKRHHHGYFVMADLCPDNDEFIRNYTFGALACPPIVEFSCNFGGNATAAACTQAWKVVSGAIQNNSLPTGCLLGSALQLRRSDSDEGPTLYSDAVGWATLNANSYELMRRQVYTFLEEVAAQSGSGGFSYPSTPLSTSLQLNGWTVPLLGRWRKQGRGIKRFGNWPPEMWAWKVRCPDTSLPATYGMLSEHNKVTFPSYSQDVSAGFSIQFMDDEVWVPAYKVDMTDRVTGAVTVYRLQRLTIPVVFVPVLGGCASWKIHKPGLGYNMTLLWNGTFADLNSSITEEAFELDFELEDWVVPNRRPLPDNKGAIYIYVAVVLGGVWLFSLAPTPLCFLVILCNVRRRQGLPPPFYQYMRSYRGWGRMCPC